jgi:ABC-type lipoprotein export system ATPase subunit
MHKARHRIKSTTASFPCEVEPVKIRIKNLTKEFHTKDKTFTAIDDVSLDIAPGTFFMIVGPSGCGKTTLAEDTGGSRKANWR